MDLAQAFNAPVAVTVAGRPFTARQLTLAEWAGLQAWLKTAAPSPVTQALRAVQEARDLGVPLAPDVREALFDHAQEQARRWPPAFGGRAWLRAVDSVPGGPAKFLQTVLGAAGHALSDDEAQGLADGWADGEVAELCRVAYHGDPPEAPDPRPKAAAPAGTAATTPGTTGGPPSTSSPRGAGRTRRSAG